MMFFSSFNPHCSQLGRETRFWLRHAHSAKPKSRVLLRSRTRIQNPHLPNQGGETVLADAWAVGSISFNPHLHPGTVKTEQCEPQSYARYPFNPHHPVQGDEAPASAEIYVILPFEIRTARFKAVKHHRHAKCPDGLSFNSHRST